MPGAEVALHAGLRAAARERPSAPALLEGDRVLSFAGLDALADRAARALAAHGVGPGSRVAVMTANRHEFVAVTQGISRRGAAAVLLSPAWRQAEVDHALAVTEPAFAVTDGAATPLLARRLGAGRTMDLDRAPGDGLPDEGPGAATAAVRPGDDAVLVFSSGTTGMPKAVRHTHRSIVAGTDHWIAALGLGAADRFQVATPPSHILGLLNLLAALGAGATVRLHRRFDLDEELRCIEADRLTLEMAVAPIALAMARHPGLEDHDLSSLRYIVWGATPVTASVAEEVTRRTGVRWLTAYGASELPVITANQVGRPGSWRLDSAGLPVPGVELRVAHLDTGAVLPAGEAGEIQARSPSLMAGYLPHAANEEAFVDGWYRTGDVGWLEPGGWIHLTDRCREMIKVNGFQVAPAEVEAVLHGHPGVVDCAVFGVADESAGEVPVAAVHLDGSADVSADELRQLVGGTLATYKHLRDVHFVDEIPRLPSGKVLRRELRAAYGGG